MKSQLACLFGMLLFFGCSSPKKVEKTELVQIHHFTLKNKIRVILFEDHSSPTLAYQSWYRVGSRNEQPGKTGLAHFFEHMMFNETLSLKAGEADRILEEHGVEGRNAFTTHDATVYIQELPSQKLDLIARLEAERMEHLVINDGSFQTEREVIKNERRYRNENDPLGQLDEMLYDLAFKKHPYHWPVIGYADDLDRLTVSDAVAFYREFYEPAYLTIVISGDIVPEDALAILKKYYEGVPSRAEPKVAIASEPPQIVARSKTIELSIQVEKVLLAYRVPELTHPDIPALSVLHGILYGGRSSRLSKALVDTGIASSVDAFDFGEKDPSLLVGVINLQEKKHWEQAEKSVLKELSLLRRELVSSDDLEKAKNRITFQHYEGFASNSKRALFLGSYEALTGDYRTGIRMNELIQYVTQDEVLAVAQKYFKPSQRIVMRAVPKLGSSKRAPKGVNQ